MKRTRQAIRECAEAMSRIANDGMKAFLDDSEKLWWRMHLPTGELMSPKQYKAAKARRLAREGNA